MAWEKRLLAAQFRGAIFDCQLADDDGERHAAEHARPYVDGAEMEDLGRGARRIRMKAVFFGDDYEDRLENFLKALDDPGPGDLVHPVFGPLKAQLLTFHVHHESDLVDQAEVELTFAESALGRPIFADSSGKAAGIAGKASGARSAAATVLAAVVAKCANAQAMARAGLRAVAELKAQAGGVVTSGAGILTAPASFAADLASLVTGIVDLRSFGASSLLPDFAAVFAALTSAVLLPADSSGGGSSGSSSIAAAYPVTEGAELDQVTAHVEAERALGVAEAAQLVLESEAETPTLTPAEVEAVAADTRTVLQTSVDTYREVYPAGHREVTEPLKDVALAVQEAAAAVIAARPPLVTHTVAGRTCPRLLAHQLYGDHARAPEIVRLNALADPNYLTAGEVLRVYAE